MTVVVVDNYDSFTYNLVDYVSAHADVEVVYNDAPLTDVRAADPDGVVISPGPGDPATDRDVGVTLEVLREVSPRVPTFGVCLGLEAAVYAYGGRVGRAPTPVHGKTSPISHDGRGVFAGLEQGFRGGRYHSLVATEVPDCFVVTATTEADGAELVMGVRHREHPIECVQFHPESVLTAAGPRIVRNFVDGLDGRPRGVEERDGEVKERDGEVKERDSEREPSGNPDSAGRGDGATRRGRYDAEPTEGR